jgi:hypothetical protein
MKQFKSFFLLCLSLTILASCKDDDDKPDEPNYGIEFFECKINGEPFQAVSIPFQCSGPVFDYYPEPFLSVPEGYCLISGLNCQTFEGLSIRIDGLDHQLGNLNFVQPTFADSIYPIYRIPDINSGEILKYESLVNGNMDIEQFIPRESGSSPLGTIKGNFNFILTDELGIDTIHVTEGRFRFDVPQIF